MAAKPVWWDKIRSQKAMENMSVAELCDAEQTFPKWAKTLLDGANQAAINRTHAVIKEILKLRLEYEGAKHDRWN